MQTETVSPHDHTPDGLRAAAVAGLLRSFARTVVGLRIYDAEHPATKRAAAEASGHLHDAHPAEEPIHIAIAADRLLVGGESPPPDPVVRGLIEALNDARVATLSIQRELDADALVALARALAIRPAGSRWGALDDRALAAQDGIGGAVSVVPVTYSALSARDLEEHAVEQDRFQWWHLIESIARGNRGGSASQGGHAGSGSVGTGASSILGMIERRLANGPGGSGEGDGGTEEEDRTGGLEGTGGGVGAVESLAAAVRGISAVPGSEERHETIRGLSAAIAGLNPEARKRLAAIDSSCPARSLAALAELSDVLPAEDVIRALGAVGTDQALPCAESLRLLSRLAFATRGDDRLAAEVKRTADRVIGGLGIREDDEERAATLKAFRRLLERSGESKYNPDDYERLISTLASPTQGAEIAPERVFLAGGWEDERLHAATLAASVIAEPGTHANDAAGLLRRLDGRFDVIVGAGRIDLVAGAARAADLMLAMPCSPEATEALKAFTLGLRTSERLGQIIAAVPSGDPRFEHIAEVVRLGGTDALVAALNACAADNDARPEIAALLGEPGAAGAEALSRIGRADPKTGAWLLSGGLVPVALLHGLVAGLISNTDPASSEDAFLGLHAASHRWTFDQVSLAMKHPSDLVRSLGMTHAADLSAPERLCALEGMLANAPRTRLSTAMLRSATARLVGCGPDGLRHAMAAFGTLARKPTPLRLAAAFMLLGAISSACDASSDPATQAGTLRLWKMAALALLGRNP